MPSAKQEPTLINRKIKHLTRDDRAGPQEKSKKQDTPRKTLIQPVNAPEFKHHGRSLPHPDCTDRTKLLYTVIQPLGVQANSYPHCGIKEKWKEPPLVFALLTHSVPNLDFTFFLKSQEIMEIDTKSSENAYEMYKLVNFWNLMKKTGKNTECQKRLIFVQTYMKLVVAMET